VIPSDPDSLVARYPEIDVPTLLLWGDMDRVTPPSYALRLAEALPSTDLHVLPDCGHMPQDEHPAETLELVTRFLRDLPMEPG
jgi:pimeloyl-ACP methyl ester carboxylesterase